jgi:hypothetical protein
MGSKKLGQLCQSILPAEFDQLSRLSPKIQKFLEENLPETVSQSVTLLIISQQEIVIAGNSPMVANYLRLHSSEIQQQIRETFNMEQPLKFCSMPDSLLKPGSRDIPVKPESVSPAAIESIASNAEWIEDENLKQALLSLAESLRTPTTGN